MTKIQTTRYDVAEHLRTQEEMAAYLEACLEEADGDAAFVAKALGDIARAKGMAQVAPGLWIDSTASPEAVEAIRTRIAKASAKVPATIVGLWTSPR